MQAGHRKVADSRRPRPRRSPLQARLSRVKIASGQRPPPAVRLPPCRHRAHASPFPATASALRRASSQGARRLLEPRCRQRPLCLAPGQHFRARAQMTTSVGTPRVATSASGRRERRACRESSTGVGWRGIDRGSARAGPRRLTMSTVRPSADGLKASRNNAGDESCAAAKGLTITKSVSDDCAARCRRRSDDAWAYCAQKMSALQLPARRICSADQSASAVFCALTRSTWSMESPM